MTLRVGIGGPVGSGKTALTLALCRALRDRRSLGVVTNDIFTREDAEFLARHEALPHDRFRAVETGGCPHTAIREDASINLAAVADMSAKFPGLDAIGQALAAGVEETGVTVHFVDEGVDTGPPILQRRIPVPPGGDRAQLEAAIHAVEHQLYPEAIRMIASGRVRIDPGDPRAVAIDD